MRINRPAIVDAILVFLFLLGVCFGLLLTTSWEMGIREARLNGLYEQGGRP